MPADTYPTTSHEVEEVLYVTTKRQTPIQDAVVAFCVLVRAVADGNQTRQQEQVAALHDCGFDVFICEDSAVKRRVVSA